MYSSIVYGSASLPFSVYEAFALGLHIPVAASSQQVREACGRPRKIAQTVFNKARNPLWHTHIKLKVPSVYQVRDDGLSISEAATVNPLHLFHQSPKLSPS